MTSVHFENGMFHFVMQETSLNSNRYSYPTKFAAHPQMFRDLFSQMITAAAFAGIDDQWYVDAIRLLTLAQAAVHEKQLPRVGQVHLAELA